MITNGSVVPGRFLKAAGRLPLTHVMFLGLGGLNSVFEILIKVKPGLVLDQLHVKYVF